MCCSAALLLIGQLVPLAVGIDCEINTGCETVNEGTSAVLNTAAADSMTSD